MAEMCTLNKVNYSVVFLILLFVIFFSFVRHKIFSVLETFNDKKEKTKKNIETSSKDDSNFIVYILRQICSGNIFPTKEDTIEKLKKQKKNIKSYPRKERVNILSKYYILFVKDKLALF
jgi:hypothetical protein